MLNVYPVFIASFQLTKLTILVAVIALLLYVPNWLKSYQTTGLHIVLPPQFNNVAAVGIKVIYGDGCERFEVVYCNLLPPVPKQFQDYEYFEFMDFEIYDFQ